MPSASSINVSLPPHPRAWIAAQVASGRCRSAGDVVRDALRHLRAAEAGAPARKPKLPEAATG